MTTDHTAAVQRTIQFYETLSPELLAQLGQVYHPQARFKDPFNDVHGLHAIAAIFEHMFTTLKRPRFVVTAQVLQGNQCFLTWEFRFYFKTMQTDTEQTILGASHLVFSDDGLITLHRDYWDAAEELYEKLPVLGSLMRWLKRRART